MVFRGQIRWSRLRPTGKACIGLRCFSVLSVDFRNSTEILFALFGSNRNSRGILQRYTFIFSSYTRGFCLVPSLPQDFLLEFRLNSIGILMKFYRNSIEFIFPLILPRRVSKKNADRKKKDGLPLELQGITDKTRITNRIRIEFRKMSERISI